MRSEGLQAGVWRGASSSPERAGAEQMGWEHVLCLQRSGRPARGRAGERREGPAIRASAGGLGAARERAGRGKAVHRVSDPGRVDLLFTKMGTTRTEFGD